MRYELYYWPSIQGRGEFVRLALEDAGADYVDIARKPKGMTAMMRLMESRSVDHAPYAPPFLQAGKLLIAQTANILFYLGPRLGLVPKSEPIRLWAHQLQLTIADWVAEAHDTHHPIASSLYYEDQKAESKRRAANFTDERMPKYLGYFETNTQAQCETWRQSSREECFLCRSFFVSSDRRLALRLPARHGGGSNPSIRYRSHCAIACPCGRGWLRIWLRKDGSRSIKKVFFVTILSLTDELICKARGVRKSERRLDSRYNHAGMTEKATK